MKSGRDKKYGKPIRKPARRRHIRKHKLTEETAMAIALFILMLVIAGAFIYLDNYAEPQKIIKQPVSAVGHVTLEVIAPQNNTITQPPTLLSQGGSQ